MDDERLGRALAFFKALAAANRLRIVGLLVDHRLLCRAPEGVYWRPAEGPG